MIIQILRSYIIMDQPTILFILLSTFHLYIAGVASTSFTIVNNCNYTVWPAIVSHGSAFDLSTTGFELQNAESRTISAPTSWSGSFWGRTLCTTDSITGRFSCITGDCDSGKPECEGKGTNQPATMVEISLGKAGELDSYYVSLVNGSNVPMLVFPQGENCLSTGCTGDLNNMCPPEIVGSNGGKVVACLNACKELNPPQYCSEPNRYSQLFDSACPYAQFFDDNNNNNGRKAFTCPAAPVYSISFCNPPPNPDKRHLILIIVITVIIGAIIINGTCAYFFRKWIAKHSARIWRTMLLKRGGASLEKKSDDNINGEFSHVKFPQELFVYDFKKVAIATNNFHLSNKLGQGGFGPVYKGTLPNGQVIAIKRLSRASGQGQEEFMNEMVVISKLQHRNLVRLLGCCVKGEEKILIYEYMPNRSLDAFIFDPSNRKLLDWGKRFNIIEGIARGVLYLHRDSRLRIIQET